ncbi:MAG TPA: DUF4270 family protein [Chitinophaga sp.]|uniref:DUF4270 family protein n=1 Tax=Chitinophaga sp. TaxID=1869181 RepID=UPI002CDF0526|nr:DUF4270 family protein [Chitinophaga sp.]HVI47575.1 DUF4270 family protein [Chitinophaga sp.]
MNQFMHHHSYTRLTGYIAVIILMTVFSSCDKKGFVYDNIVDNDQSTDYILTDTLTVQMKTIRYDSVATSGAGALLTGIKTDPLFGTTNASSFFQLASPTDVNIPVNGAKYDSMALLLQPNGYVSGDSLIPQNLEVYRVTSVIQPAKNFYYLYNNSNFPTESTPLGTFTGTVRPHADKKISIRMSDNLGQQLFTMLRDKNPNITTLSNFLQFFKGMQVRPGAASRTMTGFRAEDTTVVLRLYYHINELITTVKYVDFKMDAPELQFNRVLADRSGTPLATLQGAVKELPSEQTGNAGFMQPVTGVATRIDIPYLKNLPFLGKFFRIMKVILVVKPVNGSSGGDKLPQVMALCAVNKNNDVTDTLAFGSLVEDKQYNEYTNYSFDISNYCAKQITADDLGSRGLLLTPRSGDGKTTITNFTVNDKQARKNKITAQLYYLLYK